MPANREINGAEISPPPSKRRKTLKGDPSGASSPETTIQIYSWNVNGITPFLQPSITSFFSAANANEEAAGPHGSSQSLRDVLKRYNWPTMLLLQEVKINPDDRATQRAVERAVAVSSDDANAEPSYRAFFSLPSDKYNARGFGRKVYGVCSLIREDFVDAFVDVVREVEWDVEGRFLVCETKAMDALPKLAIFNVYAVNGTDAPYKDPETGRVSGTRHDRKLKVHELLQSECRALEAKGFHVVLAGDMNIARSGLDGHPNLRTFPVQHCVNRADFNARFLDDPDRDGNKSRVEESASSLRMVDSFRELHQREAGYTYYPRTREFGASCDRVDMILLSSSLRASLREAGMHANAAARGPSDHVPLYSSLTFGQPG